MAAPSRIVSLDLGNQTVALGEFRAKPDGGLVLTGFRTSELLADPAADAQRQNLTKFAVADLVQGSKLAGHAVNYAVSAQSVFTRFVPLPTVAPDQVEQIVTFEAQQNVPYAITEVVWDYQLVETSDSNQVSVVIVAIKSDLLDSINEAVETPKLKTAVVDVSPMALYNAFRYNYGNESGCSLIVDIGARTTNLVFVEPKKVFTRSIVTGGNTITAQIAKDFNEGFNVAEDRKKKDGFVSLGGAYADPDDPDAARISKITRNIMTRLHAEITRSISFYRSQQSGSQPARVFLAGGGASMPYMREFFQEKFQVPVEYFNPLRNVAVGPGLNTDEIGQKAHTMGALVGLALRDTTSCPMELDLQPASVTRRQRTARQKPALVLASLCLLAALGVGWYYFTRTAEMTNSVTQSLEPKVQGLKGYETKINASSAELQRHEREIEPTLQTVGERDYWSKVFADISSRVPAEFVWITTLDQQTQTATPPRGGAAAGGAGGNQRSGGGGRNAAAAPAEPQMRTEVTVRGLYLENARGPAVVDDFLTELEKSELYTVDRARLERETPNEGKWAFDYSFPLIMKKPINPGQQLAARP